MKLRPLLVIAAALRFAAAAPGHSEPPAVPQLKLLPPDPIRQAGFGNDVALSGDTAVVGYAGDAPGGVETGSVCVYANDGNGWSLQAELFPPNGFAYEGFGWAVALSGDTLVVGAEGVDSGAGAAFVYVRNGTTWSEQAMLEASDGMAGDEFGVSVAVSGDTALVGAPWNDAVAGAAYIFVRNGTIWNQQAKLVPQDAAPQDFFGFVSLSGDTALIGAPGKDTGAGSNAGAAYVFVRSGTSWSEQADLTEPAGAVNDEFGSSVSLSGDTVLIGAPYAKSGGKFQAGSAYAFVRNGTSWNLQARLTAYNAYQLDNFGYAVALSGDEAVITAPGKVLPGKNFAGAAYPFVRHGTSWTTFPELDAADATAGDELGLAAAQWGDTSLIGVPYATTPAGVDAGAAYIFSQSNAGVGTIAGHVRDATNGEPIAGATVTAPSMPPVQTDAQGAYAFGNVPVGIIHIKATAAGFNPADIPITVSNAVTSILDFYLVPTFEDLGQALFGTAGKPKLVADGTLEADTPVTLNLELAKAFAPATLIVGTSPIDGPFKGGLLVPDPLLLVPATTNGFGTTTLHATWPAGIPSGFNTYLQWWIQDNGGPKGFAASNALMGTTP